MKEEVDAPGCGRQEDLISYLYDELDPDQITIFRIHLQECRSCTGGLTKFTNIRKSVVAWRDESLTGVTLPTLQASTAASAERAKPAALTALREFFNLSPLWMKGAVVCASLLFCLLAVLAAARLRDPAPSQVTANSNTKSYTDQQLKALLDQRVQEELQQLQPSQKPPAAEGSADRVAKKTPNRSNQVVANVPRQQARRPLSKVERQQLAADLRLIDNSPDGELELLDDRINQ